MLKVAVSNQRGGASKTTTVANLGWCFAERGMRVLVVDADPQGSLAVVLGLRPTLFLSDLMIDRLALRECVVSPRSGFDIVCGNRHTTDAESRALTIPGSEYVFQHLLADEEKHYDVILLDVAPSISLFQTCAMVYAQRVLVPVDMDILSVQGATSTIQACETLNRMLERGLDIRPVGILPVKMNRRLAVTDIVLSTLQSISERLNVPLFEAIRTDQSVVKAGLERQFLGLYDPKSKALEDYGIAADVLLSTLSRPKEGILHG